MASIAIPLHSRKYPDLHAIVDEQDADLVSQYRWNVQPGRNTFYAIATVRIDGVQKTLRMHRVISQAPDDRFVDHWDNDGLNNTRNNLRIATNQQNLHNRLTPGASRYIGVSWGKGSSVRPWKAYVGLNGKPVYLGRFATEVDAAMAYDRSALDHFGEAAALNFPVTVEAVEDCRNGVSTPIVNFFPITTRKTDENLLVSKGRSDSGQNELNEKRFDPSTRIREGPIFP